MRAAQPTPKSVKSIARPSGILRLLRRRVKAITNCDHAWLKDDGYTHCPKCGDPI